MVTGGKGGVNNSVQTTAELLSINGTRLCSMGKERRGKGVKEFGHSQTGLLICGYKRKRHHRCNTFSGGKWRRSHTLKKPPGNFEFTNIKFLINCCSFRYLCWGEERQQCMGLSPGCGAPGGYKQLRI